MRSLNTGTAGKISSKGLITWITVLGTAVACSSATYTIPPTPIPVGPSGGEVFTPPEKKEAAAPTPTPTPTPAPAPSPEPVPVASASAAPSASAKPGAKPAKPAASAAAKPAAPAASAAKPAAPAASAKK